MRLWLKPGANTSGTHRNLKVSDSDRADMGDFGENNLGEKFISVGHISNPESGIPEYLDELIERVDAEDRIFSKHYPEGVYRHDGATLVASIDPRHMHNPKDPDMIIRVSGPSVEAVRALYFLFRQGKVSSEEDWSSPTTDSSDE